MAIIGYHLTKGITACSDGSYVMGDNAQEHLDLLLKYPNGPIGVFWHMESAVAIIIGNLLKLTKEQAETLYNTGDLRIQPKAILMHIPSKFFSIRNGTFLRAPLSMWSDMAQFQDCVFSKDETIESCMKKAMEAKELGEKTMAAAAKVNLIPTTLTSPIRIFEKKYLGKYDKKGNPKPKGVDLPTTDSYPEDIREDLAFMAYNCVHGGWVESFYKGHFPNAADYDISSAYSFYESELLDLRFGDWHKSKEYDPTAEYGFCNVNLDMKASFHPILYNIDVENHFTPIGYYENYATTKQEIDLIREYNLGEVEILNGYWWRCKRPYRPLRSVIQWLLGLKNTTEGFDREFVKRVLNGMWGIMLQVKRGSEVGEHFNPVWGSIVETQCRLDVFKFCLKAMQENKRVLHIAVDGVLTDEPVSFINKDAPKTPGTWRLEANCPALVISSGCVAIQDKLGKGEFGMDYNWLISEIKKHPKLAEYPDTKWSPYTLAKSLNENKYDKIGEISELTKTIDVRSDIKRNYTREPKNGGELLNNIYESAPLDTGALHDLIIPTSEGGFYDE
jgi:hypothetical protein